MQFAAEGMPLIYGAGLVMLVLNLLGWWWAGLAALVATLAVAAFFRDPEREIPDGDDIVVSPADGRVVLVADNEVAATIPGRVFRRVSIFMSPANVHVNRAPAAGEILSVRHTDGKFLAAYSDRAPFENERNEVAIRDAKGRTLVFVQIAGLLARRIVCRVAPGDRLQRGERYGLIMFGSRVDVYLPMSATLRVRVGERVRAGSDVLGELAA
jgi:phosphatidylserine decarboxylase